MVRSGAALDCTVAENDPQKSDQDGSKNRVTTPRKVTDKVRISCDLLQWWSDDLRNSDIQ